MPSKKQKSRLRTLVNALLSNKYTQGREMLHNPNNHTWCCLGVATDIYFDKTHQGYWDTTSDSKYAIAHFTQSGQTAKIFMDKEVMNWYGFTDNETHELIDMNDQEIPFKDIANHIKANKVI